MRTRPHPLSIILTDQITLLCLLWVFANGCTLPEEKRQDSESLTKQTYDTSSQTLRQLINKIPQDTMTTIEKPGLSFDQLRRKFNFQTGRRFSFYGANPSDYYLNDTLYYLTTQDLATLQLGKWYPGKGETYRPKIVGYSQHSFSKDIYGLTFLNLAEGGYILHLATYQGHKLISYGEEPLAFSFRDMGVEVLGETQKTGDFTYYTVHKQKFRDILVEHWEMSTNVAADGHIIQDKTVLYKRDQQEVIDSLYGDQR